MDFLIAFLSILFCFASYLFIFRGQTASKLPPGPKPLPIIGNILELPLMRLKLGSMNAIVVTSPEMLKAVLQEHDQLFSSRFIVDAAQPLDHHKYSMVWTGTGNQWRKLRKICKEQMFNVSSLDAGAGLRKEKLDRLCDYVAECCEKGRAVDIGEAAFTTALNLLSSTLFSAEFAEYNTDTSQEIRDVVWRINKCWGKPNLSDYFPVMKLLDPQGIHREVKLYYRRFFEIFDSIIYNKLKSGGQTNDMLDTLIEIYQRDETKLSRDDINHLLLELFIGGTDTTSGTVEWAMAELLSNPDKMSILRQEIKDVVGEIGQVQESDIPKLPYLAAVLKETWRLHPVGSFLIPHKAEADVEINGYLDPKDSQILPNVWAIGRDPDVWLNPESFIPERHLELDQVGDKGTGMQLIPFGAGRRRCPGMPLANRMVPLMLGNLVHKFNWNAKEIDMTDKFGAALHKALPLMATPIKL